MNNSKVLRIAKCIIDSDVYLTTDKLSKMLNVAPKTITNHMEEVATLFLKYNINLERKRGLGIKAHASSEDTIRFTGVLASLNSPEDKIDSLDRKLYILDKLLNKNETIKVSDLEDMLFLSKPSIYKDLEEVENWLLNHDITLVRTRKDGISISSGEKRNRIAIVNWYMLTKKYLNENSFDTLDPLKLKVSLDQYRKYFSNSKIDSIVKEISYALDIKFISDEFQRLCILFHIALPRFVNGHTVTIRAEVKELLKTEGGDAKILKISRIIKEFTNVELTQNELYYLYGIVVMAKTHENKNTLISVIEDAIVKKITDTVYIYYKISDKEKFETSIRYQIGEAINKFNLGADFYNPLQAQIEEAHPDAFNLAKIIVPIIQSYFNFTIPKDEIAYIAIHIASAIEDSKKKLKALYVYSGSYSEALFFMQRLKHNTTYLDIVGFFPHPPANEISAGEDIDVVITNKQIICDKTNVVLPTILARNHLLNFTKTAIDLYEEINIKKIKIKDII